MNQGAQNADQTPAEDAGATKTRTPIERPGLNIAEGLEVERGGANFTGFVCRRRP